MLLTQSIKSSGQWTQRELPRKEEVTVHIQSSGMNSIPQTEAWHAKLFNVLVHCLLRMRYAAAILRIQGVVSEAPKMRLLQHYIATLGRYAKRLVLGAGDLSRTCPFAPSGFPSMLSGSVPIICWHRDPSTTLPGCTTVLSKGRS